MVIVHSTSLYIKVAWAGMPRDTKRGSPVTKPQPPRPIPNITRRLAA
jgi:hypothetical protein